MAFLPVSVIVAIYNAEKTLPRLLDSLRAQTMQDFEVLMIDDGSTDKSGQICDRYAALDKRFKAFHKPNEGIGTTRQFGIEHAIGDYTIHADADDWVEPDYIELLYQEAIASGVDIVICDYFDEQKDRTVYKKQKPNSLDCDGLINDMLLRLQNGPCNKLIKRSSYIQRNITYQKGLDGGEDQLFNLQLIKEGATVSYLPKALYHYDTAVNPMSASHACSLKNVQHEEKFVSGLRNLLPDGFDIGIDNKNLKAVYMAIMSRAYTKKQFLEHFSFLSRVKWKDYNSVAFSFSHRIIIWTSLNISYKLAVFLSWIKKVIRRIRS